MLDVKCRDCRELAMLEQELAEKDCSIGRLEAENQSLLAEIRRLRGVVRELQYKLEEKA